MVVVTNSISIYVICLYTFVLVNQLKMFRFIKGKVDIYTKVLKVLGLNMEPTLDLLNESTFQTPWLLEASTTSFFSEGSISFQKDDRISYSSLMVQRRFHIETKNF